MFYPGFRFLSTIMRFGKYGAPSEKRKELEKKLGERRKNFAETPPQRDWKNKINGTTEILRIKNRGQYSSPGDSRGKS